MDKLRERERERERGLYISQGFQFESEHYVATGVRTRLLRLRCPAL